jgi:hypothetical protein
MRPQHFLVRCVAAATLPTATFAQFQQTAQRYPISGCPPQTAVEFISPMFNEEVAVLHNTPMPQSWHVIIEVSMEQSSPASTTAVREGQYILSPGLTVPMATDLNFDAVLGDAHPAMPALTVTMNDGLIAAGTFLPPGTNLASLFEMIGSEIEHVGDQTTMLTWIVTPQFQLIDLNGDMATDLSATVNGVTDVVHFRHGVDPMYMPCSVQSTPTVSIFGPDWISTIDSMVMPGDMQTAFLVGVEVRIPCRFNPGTIPPQPIPFDPLPGPGGMVMTGNFPGVGGPGGHPAYPTLDVRFSDDYFDAPTGSLVPGGVITGGTCATIWGATGANLAFAFEQASVDAWYGVDGLPNFTPMPADDQLIYRFTMIGNGTIMDTDALPGEMLITATIETECNVFSITNVRVKHRPDIVTPNPQ